jgi:hypothetical protein
MQNGLIFLLCLIVLTSHAQPEIPFKSNDQFEARIDLVFKKRESADVNTYQFSDGTQNKKTMDTPIAFLSIDFTALQADDEVKMKVVYNNNKEKSYKVAIGKVMKLELGYVEDIKSKGEATEVVLLFLNDKKQVNSKVILKINEDGTFLVNNEKRGKF